MYEVEGTDEFAEWFGNLDEQAQDAVDVAVEKLAGAGHHLGRPAVDSVKGSSHSNLKELRAQAGGRPVRVFFAFDPRRIAILLIGGDKTGDKRFYDRMIPIADALLDDHLATIAAEMEENDA